MWAAFAATVLVMLVIDFLALGGARQRKVSIMEAAGWSLLWVAVSLGFAGVLWWHLDAAAGRELANEKTLEFITGYLIEKSLAVDNVFVWLMLFSYFAVPAELQRRVLALGVLGAIVMRTVMILAGAWLVASFHWILYLFGAFLLLTGMRMWRFAGDPPNLADNRLIRWLRRHLKVTDELHGERFFVRRMEAGVAVRHATPLFVALIMVEATDLIFAVDSIPAVFAVTTDPFIVLTSNVFAILGLRAMYFLVADLADRFSKLNYGLAVVLGFVGVKMLLVDVVHIPTVASLCIVAFVIGAALAWSLISARRERRAGPNS